MPIGAAMKTLVHPVTPGLQAIETENEPSAASADVAPTLPIPAVGTNSLGRVINLSIGNDIYFLSDLEAIYDNNITVHGLAGKDNIIGYFANDKLFGDGGDDTLQGGAGNDDLEGGDDIDLLIGGAGADILSGGAGIDTVSYEDAQGQVAVYLFDPTQNS